MAVTSHSKIDNITGVRMIDALLEGKSPGANGVMTPSAMIDTLGDAEQVNNYLAALYLKTISNSNLKKKENRAGDAIVSLSEDSSRPATQEAFTLEMRDIAEIESVVVKQNTEGLVEDLGVSALPDASLSMRLCIESLNDEKHDWTDLEDERSTEDNVHIDKSLSPKSRFSVWIGQNTVLTMKELMQGFESCYTPRPIAMQMHEVYTFQRRLGVNNVRNHPKPHVFKITLNEVTKKAEVHYKGLSTVKDWIKPEGNGSLLDGCNRELTIIPPSTDNIDIQRLKTDLNLLYSYYKTDHLKTEYVD